jgi:putative heme-binding domain-containing protein
MTRRSARWAFFLALATLIPHSLGQDDPNLIAPTEALPPSEQIKKFHLPPGFEIELIVAEPEIGQPTNINFDSAGRLWINSTLEYPYPAEGKPRDRVRHMEDTDNDGVPDSIHTFAEELNIPIGVAKVHDGLLAHSIPNINRFRDIDGDGKADQRDVLYGEFGFRDTHGMASSFRPWIDGWVYACHGFANDSRVKGTHTAEVVMNSGNTYRFRADGSQIEQRTWGQVNPYGLAFNAWGDLFSSDCHTKPAYMLLTGAYYPSFGKPHDGLGFGPEMMQHLHGSTGIAGIVVYEANHFPKEYRRNLFIGNPVTGRVNRDILQWKGASPNAIEQPDFLSCDDRWFRPVDIALAPDGSLYVADFYNCIIGHYEVPLPHPRRDREHGRVWRVTYKGTPDQKVKKPRKMPDLTKLDAAALVEKLGDSNLTVRTLATNELTDRIGPSALPSVEPALASEKSAVQRSHALWVVERLRGLTAGEIDRLRQDPKPIARTHLLKALAERKDWPASGEPNLRAISLSAIASDRNAHVVHAAVDALARHPDPANIEPLLTLWRKTTPEDTHLIHATRIAIRNNLRDLGKIRALAESLGNEDDTFHRIADVCLAIPNADAAAFLSTYLARPNVDVAREREYFHQATRYGEPATVARLVELAPKKAGDDVGRQANILRALFNGAQERGEAVAPSVAEWASSLAGRLVKDSNGAVCRQGIELARDLRVPSVKDSLTTLASKNSPHADCRVTALESLIQIDPKQAFSLLTVIVPDAADSLDIRQPAAEMLGKLKDPAGTPILKDLLTIATGNLAVFAARGLSWSNDGADTLLTLMETGKAPAELLNDPVVSHELKFREAPRKEDRIKALKANIPTPDQAVRTLMEQRLEGWKQGSPDRARGEAIFNKNCGICHQIAGKGAKIGPQLDGVGIRGIDRLLEDTIDPDRNVDQAFRKTTFAMTDGSVFAGLILRREGAVIVVADQQGKEVRIAAADVEEQNESKLSPMPSDVARGLAPADFHDLMAYLLAQRAPAGKP